MFMLLALHETVPCPHCTGSLKSHQWHMFAGALGDYLLSPEVSDIAPLQSEALRGIMRICGLMRAKVVDKKQQAVKQASVVTILVKCECRLPLYTCRIVRHTLLHFYEIGGWADDIGTAPSLQK